MAAEPILVRAFSDLISDFNRRGVNYALAGGWAYSALVEPRATTDIDLLILLDPPSREQIQALVSSLFDSTIIHPTPMALQGISIWRSVVIRSGQEVVIDFLLADSAYLRTALERRHTVPFGALQVPMLSLEDLIILKMVAGRLQDRADLEKIRAREADLRVDWTYVERWKTMLGLADR